MVYRFFDDGSIDVQLTAQVKEKHSPLPRLGFEFRLPREAQRFCYYGYGPHESYCDLYKHDTVGMYESSAAEEYVPYILPQEHGNHYGTKLLKTANGLSFAADSVFEINVSEYSIQALTKATHTDELEKDGSVIVRIDYRNAGVGCDKIWEENTIGEKEISFGFRIEIA